MSPVPQALQRSRFLNFAHRGASAIAPENTLAAYGAAVAAGATAVEMDLHLTADGHVVLMHDSTVDRTTDGSGRIAQMSLAQIRELDAGRWFDDRFAGERVPTLEEVFERVVPECPVVVDIKDPRPALIERVVELARIHDAVDRVTVSSRLRGLLKRAKVLEPALQTGFLAYFRDWGWWNHYVARRLKAMRAETVSPNASMVTQRMVDFFHQRAYIVRAWGVKQDEALARRLIRMGVDGMTFDHPERLWELWTEEMERMQEHGNE